MKTLFLFLEDEFAPKFFELEGDYSHLHKVYINSYVEDDDEEIVARHQRKQEELSNLIYAPTASSVKRLDNSERLLVTFLDKPTKDWDHYVECGFIP